MVYEVYIDVFFVVNAILDFFVIQATKKIQHYKSTSLRIVMASMAGALCLSVFLCLPVRKYIPVRILFYVLAFGSMAVIAFPWNRKKGMIKAVLTLYGVSLLFNGIYQWLSLKIEGTFQLLVLSMAVYWMVDILCFIYRQSGEKNQHIYETHIYYKDNEILLKGLWDTGNRLRSPYHGKGVSIVNYDSIKMIISENACKYLESGGRKEDIFMQSDERMFLIPYETLDRKHALMPVFTAEKMIVEKEEGIMEYRNPLIGISISPVSSRDLFQIILTTNGA